MDADNSTVTPERRGRGRPRKNPATTKSDSEPTVKRPRGRPKGTGKPKAPQEKKTGSGTKGRPRGSKNKPKVPGDIPLASEKAKTRLSLGRPKKDKSVVNTASDSPNKNGNESSSGEEEHSDS